VKKRSTAKVLNRSDFLNIKTDIVEVPELGGNVYVRELNGLSLLKFRDGISELEKVSPDINNYTSARSMALLVSLTACDENGNLIFTQEDANRLVDTNLVVLRRLAEKAMQVSNVPSAISSEVSSNLKNAQADSSTSD
jgi:hypothetical protein